ncbi:MAG: glycosyltransferase [Caulobacterales bacterium]|nr:glycosyltransferase [Caulobacterales bacterium]
MARRRGADAPAVSVIVTTYNWPHALDLALDSLTRQTYRHLEIIVADDGSGPETAALVAKWAEASPTPIVHAWQEDDGFRAARARNLAASRASGDYLIMIDGDCLALPTFVASHVRHAEAGWFTVGRRCFMRRRATGTVLARSWPVHRWPRAALAPLAMLGGSNRPLQLISLPLSEARRKNRPTAWNKAQSCNLGVWRSDFDRVAGFEEGFETYGLEDTDFVVRLVRAGVRRITLEHADPVLHLWHARKAIVEDSRARLADVMSADRVTPMRSLLLETAAAGGG